MTSSDHPAPSPSHTGASVRTYLGIGVLLAVFTAVEVQLPTWLGANRTLLIASLLVAAFVKAGLVVLFYMHLKFDSRIFGRVFFAPLLLATLVVIGMIILFKVLPRFEI